MAGIVGLPRSWGRTKPPPGTPIDWGNPLTRGLIHAYLLNEGGGVNALDACGRKDMGQVGTLTRGFGSRGPAVTVPSASNYLTQPAWNSGLTLVGATWVVFCRLPALVAEGGFFFSRGSSPCFGMMTATDGLHLGFNWRDDYFASWIWTGGPAIPTNKDCFLAVSVGPNSALAVADDAQAIQSAGHPAQPYNGAHSIGCDTYNVPVRTIPGRYDLALFWGRTLSAGELTQVRLDPYALWSPPTARRPYSAPAAAAAAPMPPRVVANQAVKRAAFY